MMNHELASGLVLYFFTETDLQRSGPPLNSWMTSSDYAA